MNIKTLHAHFLLSIGNYNNERIGFSVELEEGEDINEVVSNLREKAIQAVGKKSEDFYKERRTLQIECESLDARLKNLRKQWDATAAFLKAQGLNPDAPSMPQFENLLSAVTVQSEVVSLNDEEEFDDNYDEDDDDEY